MKRRILIVDDLSINRSILKEMLYKDHHILEASNGREALEVLINNYKNISAILLDIKMPEMDGYEVLKRIRSNPVIAHIPVIMITGSEDEGTRVKALALGANDFVAKPYVPEVIKHCLKNNIALHEASETVSAMQRDKLTGLYSRETFFDKVGEMVTSHEPGYYIMACFDINKFKIINDQYGTQKGDEVLKHTAKAFKEGFEPKGGICCRISADNFAVLYPKSFQNTEEIIAIRSRASRVDGIVLPIMFTIGRYIIEDTSMIPAAMYDRAILAADTIKGRYDTKIAVYNEGMRERIIREQEIVNEMEQALEDGQFEVWFQPQYNHSTGSIIGAEALVRWRHPQRGLIPPNEFIPVFEENGFIYALDKFVWEEVCKCLRSWIDEDLTPLPVSVNISRYDMFRHDFMDFLKGLLKKYDLPIDLLRLEITESAFSESAEHIVKIVKELTEYGFTVEIDDFGSGFSSLNTLKDVPAQIIKLDMKFLERGSDSQRGGNIVESVVRMAKWLGISVIAEGVETIKQADYLRSIGCSYMQGYFFARPMSLDQYVEHYTNATKEKRMYALETVENLDNNFFWDPESIDTLIFNSYVGGACIYEYYQGSIELLRATEKYAQVIGSAGMTVEDALKLNWVEYLNEDSKVKVTADLEESVATKKEVTGEYVFINLPGCPHETYLRSSMRVIASAGERYLVYCTNENITAQRQSEKREREVAEEMRLIMDNINGGICAAAYMDTGDVNIIFANDNFYSMYGYTKEQFDTELNSALDPIHPDDKERTLKTVSELVKNHGAITYEYRCFKRDGTIINVRCNNSVTSFEGISDTVLLSVTTDITELSLARQGEKQAAQRLQTIMDSVDLGIIAAVVSNNSGRYLFANNFYYEMLGYTKEQFEEEINSPYMTIAPEDQQMVMEETGRLNSTGESTVLIYQAKTRDNRRKCFRSAISIGSFAGIDEPVQLSIIRDITEEVETQKREQSSAEQVQFLNDMSHELLTQPDRNLGINGALHKLMEYFQGTRAYIFEFDFKNSIAINTYEVCAKGTDPEMSSLQEIPLSRMNFWFEAFERNGCYIIEDTNDIKDQYTEKPPLLIPNITSLFIVPLMRDDKLMGMIGVDDPKCRLSQVDRLIAIGDYISAMLTRRDLNARISSDNKALSSMMSDMPGGFVRMTVNEDGSIKPVYFNEGFFALTGMNYDELMELYAEDAMAGVHPDDIPIVEDTIARMFQNGEAYSSRYRLIHGNGNYIWLTIFGRITKDLSGETFLNIYYTDATKQVKEEETQRDLLDNLPGGAALYEYNAKGGRLSIIHLNKRYWELVGRDSVSYDMLNTMDAVHPDDVIIIKRELNSAIEQNRDMVCDIRLYHEKDGFVPFHLVGRIVPAKKKIYSVYATFVRINDEPLSYQQVLPLLLSAMMDSTSDLAFAKDKDFHYISASRAFADMAGCKDENDIIGKTDYDLFDKEIADKFRRDDEELMAKGISIIDMVEPIPPVDGIPRYSSTSKYLLKDGAGNIIGMYGVGRDVTRAVSQDSQLMLVNDSIPGGLATYVCTEGDFSPKHIKLTYFNDGFCRLFGFTREEYEGRAASNVASMIFKEDLHIIKEQWTSLMKHDTSINCLYRAHVKGGGYKWISHRAVAADRHGDKVVINAILQDVTDQRELIEQLRISEEENNLAVQLGGNVVCRYIVADRSLNISPNVAASYSLPEKISDVPYKPVRLGLISPESADAYIGFFEAILHGSKVATATFQQKYFGSWRWMEAKSSTIFSDDGSPIKAVISLCDITETLERETIYKKWQQSLEDRPHESYSLFRCNLNNDKSYATVEGTLISFDFDNAGEDFNERARKYIEECVFEDDKDKYTATVNSDAMLAGYYRGKRSDMLEYRQVEIDGTTRWMRLTIDMVEHPNLSEVDAYLMYEDIDRAKIAELQTKKRSETDPLTGVLNRTAFESKVEQIILTSKPGTRHALLMLDIDGFKQVNDVFGHRTGDQALIDIADNLRSIMRRDDLVARLGGDEFLIFLSDILDSNSAAIKGRQICGLARKAFSMEVQTSGSVGIAITPHDGMDFETLYKKADAALYHVKGSGKDNYDFYNDTMADEHLKPEADAVGPSGMKTNEKKRRMLIVDDNIIDYAMLQNIFRDEFIIEKAKDGNSALIRLRHYGSAISVVLLDLMMPVMDGFAVLEKMQSNAELHSIPVIIVSGDESRDSCLKAIRKGATDFVTKPVDPDILRLRVHSAVSKTENERLRAKNCLLEIQNEERLRYEAFLDSAGITFIECNWLTGDFSYYPSISECLLGNYDNRKLWQILLSDMVADTQTVKDMQQLVHSIAEDRTQTDGSIIVRLKTPQNVVHKFRMNVRKLVNEYHLAHKLIIALSDLDYQ